MNRRDFLQGLAAASISGLPLVGATANAATADALYDIPKFGNVSLLHITDTHAQLLPIYYREPSVNIGVGVHANHPPHLVGEKLLKAYGIQPHTPQAHAFTYLDFSEAARRYGKMGGFAHLATLVKRIRAERPQTLLLDGGDTWQGSATALWTKGADMIAAQKQLGVDIMTAHWEFTYGQARMLEAIEELKPIEFLAHNVKTLDFGDPVFKPSTLRSINGVPIGIIGQAFPYTPIAHPRYFVPDWTFGIQEAALQQHVDALRAKGAQLIVLLSHNGMDVDLKLASRVRGIDVILGGHTHDAVPQPVHVKNPGGQTIVSNAGSNGKFLAVMDMEIRDGKLRDYRYRLLPVFADMLPADTEMQALITRVREPYAAQLAQQLGSTDDLLYRRGNFNGTWDDVILEALMSEKDSEIAFSPGFRWGTTLLPGQTISFEEVMNQTAITYPYVTVNELSGAQIKTIMEDVADNLFNPDPYLQQGGDMVRVGGMRYVCKPEAKIGQRIGDMRLNGKPLQADKTYKVAGWAPVAAGVSGDAIWDLTAQRLSGATR